MNDVTKQFLKDTEADTKPVDILDQPLNPQEGDDEYQEQKPADEEPQEDAEPDEDEEESNKVKPRTRRERRLTRKLEAERESSRQMAEKLQNISGAAKDLDDSEYLKGIERIYGNDTPEAQMATDLLRNALVGIRKDAEESAYQRVQYDRQAESQAEAEASAELDSFLDEVEDTYGVSLSASQERGFFSLLEKMSPKNRDGEITAYADPLAVYEVYKDRTAKQSPTRAKDVANRSMNQGTTGDSKIQDDSAVRFLQENGII